MMKKNGVTILIITVLLSLFSAFVVEKTWARDLISGEYVSASGKTIILNLEIDDPPPGNLIVLQFIPGGVDLVSSDPPVMKYDKNAGKAKWLIKKVQPGKLSITMKLSESIQASSLRAEVLCRDQQTGKMVELLISP